MMWVLSINFEAIGGVILMEPYFSHVPNIGDLNLEHTFYRYEEPILFVCVDILGNRYLCSCCQLSECWIICQVREIDLIAMIENKISLNNMFRSTNSKALFLSWNGEMILSLFQRMHIPKGDRFWNCQEQKRNATRIFSFRCKSFVFAVHQELPIANACVNKLGGFI